MRVAGFFVLVTFCLVVTDRNRIFAHVLFRIPCSGDGMKRESGANPGQSRCCELLRKRVNHQGHCSMDEGEGDALWSESEDLQNKVKKSSVRGKREM